MKQNGCNSLRDTFAAAALQGMFAYNGDLNAASTGIALICYQTADAMLAERQVFLQQNMTQKLSDCDSCRTFSSDGSGGQINRNAPGQSPAYAEESAPRDVPQADNARAAGGPGHHTPGPHATPAEGSMPSEGASAAGGWRGDIVYRLRRWTHDPHAVPASDLMDEAADCIESLRNEVRA